MNKKIGLIGGISWVSTVDYYKYINTMVNEKLGGLNFAECMIHSFNYADIKKNNDAGDWDKTLSMITEASVHLKAAGAEAIVLCANTMHLIADKLQDATGIPVIHIAEATAAAISQKKLNKVALLGTKFTMEMDFFRAKLKEKNIDVIIPGDADREFIHYTIFEELGRGLLKTETKARYISIIHHLEAQGAEGVILGCTEIPLLVKQSDLELPAFDTTLIHAQAAADFITGGVTDHL
jgi:aspartate racemase